MTGHALGAAGVHEAIYTLLMMEHNLIFDRNIVYYYMTVVNTAL